MGWVGREEEGGEGMSGLGDDVFSKKSMGKSATKSVDTIVLQRSPLARPLPAYIRKLPFSPWPIVLSEP